MSQPKSRRPPPPDGAPSAWIPARPDRRGAPPARLGDVLVGAESYLAKRSGAAIARAQWAQIVGPRIAARTRVGKLKNGVLTIKVASSAWCNELSFLASDLVRKLGRAGYDVNELKFSVDKLDNPEPAPRWRNAPERKLEPTQLPAELLERLAQVEDPNLRAAIAEAARYSLRASSVAKKV